MLWEDVCARKTPNTVYTALQHGLRHGFIDIKRNLLVLGRLTVRFGGPGATAAPGSPRPSGWIQFGRKGFLRRRFWFRGGDPAKDLYLLVDGQVAITVENTDFTYPVAYKPPACSAGRSSGNHGVKPQRRSSPWKARFSAWMANG